jgi:hypothetical protein
LAVKAVDRPADRLCLAFSWPNLAYLWERAGDARMTLLRNRPKAFYLPCWPINEPLNQVILYLRLVMPISSWFFDGHRIKHSIRRRKCGRLVAHFQQPRDLVSMQRLVPPLVSVSASSPRCVSLIWPFRLMPSLVWTFLRFPVSLANAAVDAFHPLATRDLNCSNPTLHHSPPRPLIPNLLMTSPVFQARVVGQYTCLYR